MLIIKKVDDNQQGIYLDRGLTDLLKFVACIFVAMSHYCGYALVNGVSSNLFYKVIAANGGYIGVTLFFFFSGYGLMRSDMKKHLKFWQFIKRRLVKSYFPAVLVSLLWLGVAALTSYSLLCNQHYFLGVVWRFNDEVLWFVRSIMVLYIAFGLYRFFHSISQRIQWIILLIVGVISYYFLYHFRIGSTISIPFFFIGVLAASYGNTVRLILQNVFAVFALVLILIVLLWFFRNDNFLLHVWINFFVICILLWVLSRWNITITLLPKWLGSCSYDIYLVHNKAHLLILYFFGTDCLWLFLSVSTLFTIGFYHLNKLIHF